ncbi:hypothetical protein [Anaerobiospirillum thomasii]|uniref:Uncharacterized protein n=1 Tax=Anaerobiospirillum thomasii TaxID=179995 RepID=A0A2X0WUT2_9GAMM|nr:hypothetical protein [Anaerobiospirillum thomasii]SPT70242.1 Uncharacterised protein [Anaerobiospirillum thomasii]
MFNLSFTLYKFVFILVLWLCSTIAFRLWLGNRRDMHFKRSQARLFLSRKSLFADYLAIGTPVDMTGLKLYVQLIVILAAETIIVLSL